MLSRHNIIHLLSVSECWGGAFPALVFYRRNVSASLCLTRAARHVTTSGLRGLRSGLLTVLLPQGSPGGPSFNVILEGWFLKPIPLSHGSFGFTYYSVL